METSTDDGSYGFKGKVTDLLKNVLRETRYERRRTIYTCGPKPMFEEITTLSRKFNIPAQGSLEAHMACGIGVCMGCIIKIKNPCLAGRQEKSKIKNDFTYKRVCFDGPVFDLNIIKW